MAALAGFLGDLLITSPPSVSLASNLVLTDAGDHITYNNPTGSQRYWDNTAVPTVQMQRDEVQTITITGSPTGGTFTLTFGGNTTAAINWNDSAATVQTRLQALASIGSGNVLVTGGPGPGTPYIVEFTAAKGFANQANITLTNNNLTGGSSPNVTITETYAGQGWTTVSSGFTIRYVNGAVIFTAAQTATAATAQVRLSTGGKYFPYASMGNTTNWDAQMSVKSIESTTHKGVGGSPWQDFQLVTAGGKISIKKWWIDHTFFNNLTSRTLLIASCLTPAGGRFEAYGYFTDQAISAVKDGLDESTLAFLFTDQAFTF